jgi:hypothetical protein
MLFTTYIWHTFQMLNLKTDMALPWFSVFGASSNIEQSQVRHQ